MLVMQAVHLSATGISPIFFDHNTHGLASFLGRRNPLPTPTSNNALTIDRLQAFTVSRNNVALSIRHMVHRFE